MTLATPSISSLRVTPHQVLQAVPLLLAALPNSHLALPIVRKDLGQLYRRHQASSPSPSPEPHKDVERLSLHEGHQHCVQLICQHSQSVQKHQDFSRCVRFYHRCRLSVHGPRQDISRSKDVRSRRSSLCVVPKTRIYFPCSSVAEAYQGLLCPPRLGWRLLDSWRLPLPRPLSAQRIVANLSRLGRGLAVELAAVASAATPDVTADSPFLNQCIVQQCRIAARHGPGTRNSRGSTGNVCRSRAAP